MGLRLPWMWRLGPSNSSERAHVMDMLEADGFPEKTLFCGDAGFVGDPLWTRILSRGGQFLVRVGANVNLLTKSADYSLQKNGRVLCWPQSAIRSRQAPLPLRLMKVRVGKTGMGMLTSILDASELTKKQIVQFYEMRWGVECLIGWIKEFRRIATRYEKLAVHYLGMIKLGMIWQYLKTA